MKSNRIKLFVRGSLVSQPLTMHVTATPTSPDFGVPSPLGFDLSELAGMVTFADPTPAAVTPAAAYTFYVRIARIDLTDPMQLADIGLALVYGP